MGLATGLTTGLTAELTAESENGVRVVCPRAATVGVNAQPCS